MVDDTARQREALLNKYRYDKRTGKLYHRGGPRKGAEAGTFKLGYIHILFENKQHALGRLIWLIETGEWPRGRVTFANKDTLDNRFSNLRVKLIEPRWKEGDEKLVDWIDNEARRLGVDPYPVDENLHSISAETRLWLL